MGGGAEMAPPGGRGNILQGGNRNHCLWLPSHSDIFLQTPGVGSFGIRRQLAGGDSEPVKSASEIGAFVMGAWMGRGQIHIRWECSTMQWFRRCSFTSQIHGPEGAGRLSPPVDTKADRADTTAEQGRDLDITSPGGGDGRGVNAGG